MRIRILVLSLVFSLAQGQSFGGGAHGGKSQPGQVPGGIQAEDLGDDVTYREAIDTLREFLGARRQSSSVAIDNRALDGTYVSTSAGGVSNISFTAVDVMASLGVWDFDGAGRFSRIRTTRSAISGLDTRSFLGTYSVGSDGSLFIRFANGGEMAGHVVDNGNGFFLPCSPYAVSLKLATRDESNNVRPVLGQDMPHRTHPITLRRGLGARRGQHNWHPVRPGSRIGVPRFNAIGLCLRLWQNCDTF